MDQSDMCQRMKTSCRIRIQMDDEMKEDLEADEELQQKDVLEGTKEERKACKGRERSRKKIKKSC